MGYFPHHSDQLNSPGTETNSHMVTENYAHMVTGGPEEIRHNPHMMTATQEEIPFPIAPLLLRQANKRRRAPQVNLNVAVKIPLRQLRRTKFCWPFSNWRRTSIQPISITTLAESQNCLNLSQR